MPATDPSATLAVLDIGSTLVTGPDAGPARRIAGALGLSDAERRAVHLALMTRALERPEDAAAVVREAAPGVTGPVEDAVAEVWTAQEREPVPVPGALEALGRLHAAGVRLALLSNIWTPYLRGVRAHLGAFFDAHIDPALQRFSCRLGEQKPAPGLFTGLLAAAGVEPAAAVMVGDTYATDVAPALALGMGAVWVLQRPAAEAADLVRVLDGRAPAPTGAVGTIAALTPEAVLRARQDGA